MPAQLPPIAPEAPDCRTHDSPAPSLAAPPTDLTERLAGARIQRVHRLLLEWYATAQRDLPWRHTRDPYHILVAEIMLQQTQVSRVLPKYAEFLARFPTLEALAQAERAEVVRAWETLGYNRRAVHLHTLAQYIQRELGGVFPRTATQLRKLPGIGPYTAAAVACFAFNEQIAAVDTNARRVLGRIFLGQIEGLPQEAASRALAQQVLPPGAAYAWNQAIMDLGATICTVRRPACHRCPVAEVCAARPALEQPLLPATLQRPRRQRQERFAGSARFYRGRIVQALRLLPPGHSLSPVELGRRIRADFTPDDLPWLEQLLEGLERDGLVVIERPRRVAEQGVQYDGGAGSAHPPDRSGPRVRLA